MEGLQRMVDSIQYIESHLNKTLTINEIASIAHMSKFHYQRMFHMLTGFTVSEYIRNRRLTLAANDLVHSDSKVIEIALNYGYESPEAFAKAFRKIHGISPSSARKESQSLKAFPKLSFQIQIKGDVEMDYRITEKEAFEVIGKGIRTTTIDGENYKNIASFWEESNSNGFSDRLAKVCGSLGLIGVCMDFDKKQEHLTYFIGAEKQIKDLPKEWEEKRIPASTWAVFPVQGSMPDAMPKVWERIFSEWFPSTNYEHAGGPELEVYLSDENPANEDYYSEIWIPVRKK
ncbi:AraC family transcriptional regulator [Oceanobacillus halophilus]|uniref:AraC family transcriptional regulator n=1 Tax=Oceanobacillus halophilus TaxID=930130 RepID=A0A495A1Q7_9BACI|nr:AraC family transcriptional regulator [Oceanobacillus halophilus]RKQ33205.1 AraC family transcriptional regulator [Oceanobacillus halophilus]